MKIQTGIISTSHRDRHGDIFAESALISMATQINLKYIRYLIDHDPSKQIGIILYGEVFKLADGEFALGAVVGIFENNKDRELYVTGRPNTTTEQFAGHLDIKALRVVQERNALNLDDVPVVDKSKLSLSELLALYMDSTRVSDDGQVYQIKKFVDATGGLRIEIYPRDHEHEPHYHVISKQRKLNARFNLNTHELTSMKAGKIRQDDIRKIQAFFQNPSNLEKLKNSYNSLSS